MTNQTFPISLLHIPTDKPVDAELLCTIGKEQIADWKKFWIPAKKDGLKASQESQLHKSIPGSLHWDWDKKANHANSFLACSGYSIVCEGRTEGLMVITKSIHSARLESQKGKPLIYVDYIETAPWNIKGFMPPGKYSGIGSIFLNTAIQVSVHEGYKGRIGLHSLPQAEDFYRKARMVDLGNDPSYQGLRYFEMTPKEAKAFAA